MNIFLSLNNKFFELTPEDLLKRISGFDEENLIKGFEIKTKTDEENSYVLKFASLISDKNYAINLHAPLFDDKLELKKYISFAVDLSKIQKRKINITIHSVECDTILDSVRKTDEMLKDIYDYIEEMKYYSYIDISIENLNKLNGKPRLKKEELSMFLKKYEDLKFTYDVGHELADSNYTKNLIGILDERINNIHIHDVKDGMDHFPVEDLNNCEMIKNILINYYYTCNIVMEYALDNIEGFSLEEKLKNYINYAKHLKFI